MTVALAGRAPATFEIKSANLPLLALLLKSADLRLLAAEMTAQFGNQSDFFDGEPLVVDFSQYPPDAPALTAADFATLLKLLRSYRMAPVAVKAQRDDLLEEAKAAGLVPAQDSFLGQAVAQPARVERVVETVVQEVVREVPTPVAGPGTMVVDRPLRSGQRVYARGCDLIVLAMVNQGAEVIADGHIHAYAPLRGRVMAGARGNADARIFALNLEAELISIAGIYRTSETPLPPDVQGRPAQIRLDGEKLLIQPLKA
ncbi:MAG: septum site-determining protein MinC [Comamonas sp.]